VDSGKAAIDQRFPSASAIGRLAELEFCAMPLCGARGLLASLCRACAEAGRLARCVLPSTVPTQAQSGTGRPAMTNSGIADWRWMAN